MTKATRCIVTVLALICCQASVSAEEKPISAKEAMKRLKEGNARFVSDKTVKKDTGPGRRLELAKGQYPIAVILTCADSRVAPELIFNKGLGDLFVLRVAGNVADDAYGLLGSAEYAATALKVSLIVVMGHESCGAVQAALDKKPIPGNLGKLIKSIDVGKNLPEDKKAALAAATKTNAIHQAKLMLKQSTVLKELADSERVVIVPAVYSLTTGEVSWYEPVSVRSSSSKGGR